MEKRIENTISMFKTVQTVCELNMALITPNVGLNTTHTHFEAMFNALLPVAQVQIKNRKGITKDKHEARENLILAVEQATGIIKAHFDSVHNHDIFTSVSVTLSRLRTMRDIQLVPYVQNVIDLLTTHQVVLLPFGVDAAYISNLTDLLTVYNTILSMPTAARNSKSTATLELKNKTRELSVFLQNELDNAMLILKTTQPTFYKTYRNARRIVDNGIRHIETKTGKIKGVVKDQVTNLVISDALIEVINTPTLVVTDELGEFTIANVPPATYSIKVSVGNYDTKTIDNITVTAPDTTELEIKLAPAV